MYILGPLYQSHHIVSFITNILRVLCIGRVWLSVASLPYPLSHTL